MSAWTALLEGTRTVFGAPSFALFTQLLTGWVCAPGRRTITAMIAVADPTGRRAHDAYHRFVRDEAWSMSRLWQVLAADAVTRFAPSGVVALDCDDTLFHRGGRQVNGAGIFRDAVRSTARHVVYALGLNLVVLTLRVTPPWGGCPIALPVNVRLHKKNETHDHRRPRGRDDPRARRLATRPQAAPVRRRRLRIPGRRGPTRSQVTS